MNECMQACRPCNVITCTNHMHECSYMPAHALQLRIYWGMRLASQLYGFILCIIIDAMDKTKFAWPRWVGRVSHAVASLVRPRMTFTAVLAHGWCCSLYCGPEWLTSGACYCIDLICRTIQKVVLI
jgi:hypothetical protein